MPPENQEPTQRKSLDDRDKMSELERIRHSCAHVMATAILRLWPDAQFAYVARQVAAKTRYGLWVTQAEKDAMARVLATCPAQPLPRG